MDKLSIGEFIVKTKEALIGAGLSNQTVWGTYHKHYRSLNAYFKERNQSTYDSALVSGFVSMMEEKYKAHSISRGEYLQAARAAKILVNYADSGTVYSPVLQKGTRYGLNDFYESLVSEYLKVNEFHKNTADDIEWAVRRFLYYLEQINHYDMRCVDESHARRFVLLLADRHSTGTLKNVMCYLKRFSEFAFVGGYVRKDISDVFAVPVRRENRIYSRLSDDELTRILAAIDTDTEMGKRDMAMIQLGVSVGMRAIDIINLCLGDINWSRGEIHLVQKKTGQSVFLPLMPEAGRALADYILNGRPCVQSDFIFLTVGYPVRKFTDDTGMGYIWNRYTGLAGIERKAFDGKSFHSLRRRIATKMVIPGIPITTVSQVLGQTRMDSARQYLSFDTENLRQCAVSFDGIEVGGAWDD